MKSEKGRVIITRGTGFSPYLGNNPNIEFTDAEGIEFTIPLDLVLVFYIGARHKYIQQRFGRDSEVPEKEKEKAWIGYCDAIYGGVDEV